MKALVKFLKLWKKKIDMRNAHSYWPVRVTLRIKVAKIMHGTEKFFRQQYYNIKLFWRSNITFGRSRTNVSGTIFMSPFVTYSTTDPIFSNCFFVGFIAINTCSIVFIFRLFCCRFFSQIFCISSSLFFLVFFFSSCSL